MRERVASYAARSMFISSMRAANESAVIVVMGSDIFFGATGVPGSMLAIFLCVFRIEKRVAGVLSGVWDKELMSGDTIWELAGTCRISGGLPYPTG